MMCAPSTLSEMSQRHHRQITVNTVSREQGSHSFVSLLPFFLPFFLDQSLHVALAVLELTMETTLASVSQCPEASQYAGLLTTHLWSLFASWFPAVVTVPPSSASPELQPGHCFLHHYTTGEQWLHGCKYYQVLHLYSQSVRKFAFLCLIFKTGVFVCLFWYVVYVGFEFGYNWRFCG